jgi:hypothetical protein
VILKKKKFLPNVTVYNPTSQVVAAFATKTIQNQLHRPRILWE